MKNFMCGFLYLIFPKSFKINFNLFLIILAGNLLFSCTTSTEKQKNITKENELPLFSKINPEASGINFKNPLIQTPEFNFMNYMYIFMGGGIAVGDIDNDGLEDLYFVGNFNPNKLYRNKGGFQFEDITQSSKTQDYSGFSTGVTMLDINNDGWLDIYVCKAGSLNDDNGRRNLLFVNKKDGTFDEEAKIWGLDDPGFSTQIYPIDYDKDGDLDLYLVNHRYDFENNATISSKIQRQTEAITSDQLYRNDGTFFTNVTESAGLVNKAWGLSAVVSDINEDGWDDIYLANDFWEPDALYINQKNGTFKNEILKRVKHISTNSMGSDYADINNDGKPDLITLDMLAENYARAKENMASMSTSNFEMMVQVGYHHSYMANMLHINIGKGQFIESSQMSGIVKTDWSWAPLIADFDNDGYKDLFISNGIDRDYTNRDARNTLYGVMARGESMKLDDLLNTFPREKIDNFIFRNNGDLTFSKKIKDWGLEDPGFTNGAVYADLDNDGDLDLVTNNLYENAGVYKNNSQNNHLKIKLKGPENNTLAIGTQVILEYQNGIQLQEQYITRGFESSISPTLNFGLGDRREIKKVSVLWPDGKHTEIKTPKANQILEIAYKDAQPSQNNSQNSIPSNKKVIESSTLGLDYFHKENTFNDYSLQLLIPQKQSSKGTAIITADLNNDGLEDLFIGNAAGSSAATYLQNKGGSFTEVNKQLWLNEVKYEDANAVFFDIDNDGDQDLYVVSAGYELNEDNALLHDRLYLNDGNGNFAKTMNRIPNLRTSGKAIAAADYDNDGDIDLFVGGNLIPGKYPLPPESYLLKNENGTLNIDLSSQESISKMGMVSEAIFTDYDTDGDLDLMTVGEWMQPTFYNNDAGVLSKAEKITGLEDSEGWWFTVIAKDFDEDGDDDYLVGNLGKNNKFKPSKDKPLYIYAKDFDNNGSFDVVLSKINNGKLVPVRGKECSSEQNPFLLDKIKSYQEFASLDMNAIYGEDELNDAFKLEAKMFESIYIENLGNGNFSMTDLPIWSQIGPTLSFEVDDINNDGFLDVIGVGAIYDAEVETIRYDSNLGYALLGDGNGNFRYSKAYSPFIHSDAKDITSLVINGEKHFAVVSNNSGLHVFTFQP